MYRAKSYEEFKKAREERRLRQERREIRANEPGPSSSVASPRRAALRSRSVESARKSSDPEAKRDAALMPPPKVPGKYSHSKRQTLGNPREKSPKSDNSTGGKRKAEESNTAATIKRRHSTRSSTYKCSDDEEVKENRPSTSASSTRSGQHKHEKPKSADGNEPSRIDGPSDPMKIMCSIPLPKEQLKELKNMKENFKQPKSAPAKTSRK